MSRRPSSKTANSRKAGGAKTKGADGDRLANGQFAPGWKGGPGNPHLKHAGELQRAVREAVTGVELAKVMHKLRDLAMDGDSTAARLLIERCIGKATDEPRTFAVDLPDIDTTEGVAEALRRVATAAAAGELTPSDAASVANVLRQVADADAFARLEERITELEESKKR